MTPRALSALGGGTGSFPSNRSGGRLASRRLSEKWEIDPAEILIARLPDGGPWILGEGGSGSVRNTSCLSATTVRRTLC